LPVLWYFLFLPLRHLLWRFICSDIFFVSFLCMSCRVGERGSEGRKEGREGKGGWPGLEWNRLE
jgi:hypothetical protein